MKFLYHFRLHDRIGPERVHVSGIAGGLRSLGNEVHYVSLTRADPGVSCGAKGEGIGFSRLLGMLSDRLPQVFFELMEVAYNLVALFLLYRRIQNVAPDILYERYAFFCFAGVLAAKRRQIPVLIEVNELSGFERVRGQRFCRLAKIIEKFTLRRADVVFVVSNFLKERIVELGVDPTKIHIIPNGVDSNIFGKIPDSQNLRKAMGLSDKIVLGFLGGIVHWHKFDLLFEAFQSVRLEHSEAVLVLVGDGPLKGEILRLARKFNVDDALVLVGNVAHHEVPLYINLFDIGIIPSSNEYRSPVKMFEYMAIGKPVVAPDVDPISAVIRNEVTGVLFQLGDHRSLREALISLIKSKELRRAIGCRGRKLIMQDYTWDVHAKQIDIIARGLLNIGCNGVESKYLNK